MRALMLKRPGKWAWEDIGEPEGDDVLVAVRRVGICGTDRHAFAGRQPGFAYPVRLGHELAVEMLEEQPGTLCAVNPYFNCSHCIACRAGRTNCCESLSVMGVHCDGGLTHRLRIPASHLYASSTLRLDQLAMVEPLVVGYHAVQRARLGTGDSVLIMGLGPIGLGAAMCASVVGATVICADLQADRRQAARQTTPNVLDANFELTGPVRDLLNGDLPTTIIDATGSKSAVHKSYHLLATGGQLVFLGLFPGDFAFEDLDFHRRELTLLASRNGTGEDFQAVLRLLESGQLDPSWMITHRIAFNDLPVRFESLSQKANCIKAMVTLDEQ